VGQCTFRVALCFNNTDARIPCTPAAIRSVVLKGPRPRAPAGSRCSRASSRSAPRPPRRAGPRSTAYSPILNQCTPYGDFVVGRGRTRAAVLRAVVATQAAGRDKNRLKLVCVAP
jgi:hypothetical protein